MKTGRDKRIAEEIRREVSQILHFEIKDPRVMGATVTGVRMSSDLGLARIYFAMPGAEDRKDSAKKGLMKSAPYIRHLLADRLQMKFIPQLDFFYDESFEIEAKLKEIFPNPPSQASGEDETEY